MYTVQMQKSWISELVAECSGEHSRERSEMHLGYRDPQDRIYCHETVYKSSMIPAYKYTHRQSTKWLHSPPPGGASASESDPEWAAKGKAQRVRVLNRETVPATDRSNVAPWRILY